MKSMQTFTLIVAASLSIAISDTAAAGSWYAGASYGNANFEHDVSFTDPYPGAAYRMHSSSNALTVNGGYQSGEYLAFEIDYGDYGDFTGLSGINCSGGVCGGVLQELDENLSGWSMTVLPQLPLANGWTAFAEIGLLSWHLDPNGQCDWICPDMPDRSGTDALVGAGFRYDFRRHLSVKIGYRTVAGGNLRDTLVGVEWRF